jgi:F0F1-type ATP synthase membrane subunit b/b'
MIWNAVSFFLSHEEPFIELNTNILETNLVNLLILVGLIIYGFQVSVIPNLDLRQKEISQIIENAQKDVLEASNYYSLAEKGFTQSIFWLQSWKSLYQKEKIEIVTNKYKLVKSGLLETFSTTENLILNAEKKSFLSLQRYILYITASRILRKFLFLSDIEQSKLIESTISKLGGVKK